MKILHISKSDDNGGAAKAAHRLHSALNIQGIDSYMLVQYKYTTDSRVIQHKTGIVNKFLNKINYLNANKISRLNPKSLFNDTFSFYNIRRSIKKISPDIVHLHWVNGFLDLDLLRSINLPVVWSTHDMWPFTGGCHYDGNCGRYKNECGSCPVLKSEVELDISRQIFNSKYSALNNIKNLVVVGLSKWIAACAAESSIFKNRQIVNLPNALDTEMFKPIDKKIARQELEIGYDKKVVLFGALDATTDLRKGFRELRGAIEKIKKKMSYCWY